MNKKEFIKIVDNTLSQIDFDYIRKKMLKTNWTWFNAKEGSPTEEELYHTCRRLMMEFIEDRKYDTRGTGGFTVRWFKKKKKFIISFGYIFEETGRDE